MEPTPTLEQLQLDLEQIKNCLSELSELQKLELLEIRKHRVVNSRRLASVGNRIFQLLLLGMVGGSGWYFYSELDTTTRNKLAESYISQLVPVIVAGVGAQQLFANRKEQARLQEAEADDADNELLNKYLSKKDREIS